jgi:3-oxoacyl-[acyl-carrier protein] reductase
MELGITEKTAIITGASTGIGFAIARELAENGARVVLVARTADRLHQAAKVIMQECHAEVLAVPADVSDPAAPERIVHSALARFGGVDIMINSAGRAHAGDILETTDADWEEMTATKLSAMQRFCRGVIPGMRERHWGRIVNISSIGGIYPNYKLTVSHALSAAINNLTRSLEFAPDGILINAVAVGAVITENWKHNMLPSVRRQRPELADYSDERLIDLLGKELTPVGRFGRPEEIASVVVFLASDRNSFVTGDIIQASGGADRFI